MEIQLETNIRHLIMFTYTIRIQYWFKQIPVDINCWKINELGNWNKFKKFKEIGAKILRYPESLTYKG